MMMSVTGILMTAVISISVGCSNKSMPENASVIVSKQSKVMIPFLQKTASSGILMMTLLQLFWKSEFF